MSLPVASDTDLLQRWRHLSWVSGASAIAREHWLTVVAIVAALGTTAPVVYDSASASLHNALNGAYVAALGNLFILMLTALLLYGSSVYLVARMGHLRRLRAAAAHIAVDSRIDDGWDEDSSIIALVPSYQEDPRVVARALISAALQVHTYRAVLLIDDPPADPAPASLEVIRGLPGWATEMMRPMREECERAVVRFEWLAQLDEGFDPATEARQLADLCRKAAAWFEEQTRLYPVIDSADRFFVDVTFRTAEFRWSREADIWSQLANDGSCLPLNRLRRGYQRLLSVFRVEITGFERKQFVNLSHAPNKAMNINSYLGLLGGRYRREQTDAGQRLSPCPAADDGAELIIPDADFVLILDADTIVTPDYALKLMRRFREPGGQRLAIVQSPYSTFPGDGNVLQRIAGAQTDVQYLVHQGLTHYNATYWVGANALVRTAALRDIAQKEMERGHEIVKFIGDRTLIEDTEATIELVRKGWRLFNQTERLAFSMTPPDFGSLLIQRRRWATGGLLLVPKLLSYLRQPGKITDRVKEGVMRLHYLISLGPVSMALLVALGVSLDSEIQTAFLVGSGLIYYTAYARDLHLIGYRWQDIFRVVALNLVLIPVNVLGMMLSLMQAITRMKPRFARTPKVQDRTPVPAGYVLAELTLLAIWCEHFVSSLIKSRPLSVGFMLVHAAFLAYAIGAFIGYRNSAVDLRAMLTLGRRGGYWLKNSPAVPARSQVEAG